MGGAGVSDRLEVRSNTRNLARVRAFVRAAIGRSALAPLERNKVVLAVDEAVANTMLHGYGQGSPGQVEVQVDAESSCIKVTIIDTGIKFDAAASSLAQIEMDLRRHIESGARRGLGLFIMRKVMDEIRYSSRGGHRNELTLVKYCGLGR